MFIITIIISFNNYKGTFITSNEINYPFRNSHHLIAYIDDRIGYHLTHQYTSLVNRSFHNTHARAHTHQVRHHHLYAYILHP